MNVITKLRILDDMYEIYDKFINKSDFACKKFCNYCCTCNLILTSLEAYKIVSYFRNNGDETYLKNMCFPVERRFIPKLTVNKMAEMCSNDEFLPNEEMDSKAGLCSVLSSGKCNIYPIRPFGCRSMLSIKSCNHSGYANINPFLLTVNSVFIQYIEHIDFLGFTSNFYDMICAFDSESFFYQYEKSLPINLTKNLVKNQPIKTIMVPPEHIKRIQPLLSAIREVLLD